MIEDASERIRAIMWMLADIRPDMPLVDALGHLKAIELRLSAMVAEQADAGSGAPPFAGSGGVVRLVREASVSPLLRDLAVRGDKTRLITELQQQTGCTVLTATEAASTMVNIHAETTGNPFL